MRMVNHVWEYRDTLNLSTDKLSRKSSVSKSTINRIENNQVNPTIMVALCLAKALKVNVEDLFEIKEGISNY